MLQVRTLVGAVVTAGVLGAGMVGLAGSANAAVDVCPPGGDWQLLPVTAVIDAVDNGNFADQNGDGLACFKVNKGQTAKNDGFPSYTWKDNTKPVAV